MHKNLNKNIASFEACGRGNTPVYIQFVVTPQILAVILTGLNLCPAVEKVIFLLADTDPYITYQVSLDPLAAMKIQARALYFILFTL